MLTGILFVFKTGIAWEDLPLELGCSYKTCKRRLKEWTALGIWQRIFHHMLTRLRAAGRLHVADVLVDAGLVKAPLGGQKPAEPHGSGALRQQVPSADDSRRSPAGSDPGSGESA